MNGAAKRRAGDFLAPQLASWKRHASDLPAEIDELLTGRKRIIWEDGEDITREVTANKLWQLHCLRQLIEIAEGRYP